MNRRDVTSANLSYTRAIAAVLALSVGAYANAQVTSADIVDGQVKTPDIASSAVTTAKIAGSAVTSGKLANGAVTNAKLAADAVTGVKVQDNSLTGADIDETTLVGVDADLFDGKTRGELMSMGSFSTSEVLTLPACSNGRRYMGFTLAGGPAGKVLLNASFTAGNGTNFAAPFGLAARLERETPTAIIGDWQESHFGAGGASRSNIALTQEFQYPAGGGTYLLRVCDASDSVGGVTIRGQISYIFRPN